MSPKLEDENPDKKKFFFFSVNHEKFGGRLQTDEQMTFHLQRLARLANEEKSKLEAVNTFDEALVNFAKVILPKYRHLFNKPTINFLETILKDGYKNKTLGEKIEILKEVAKEHDGDGPNDQVIKEQAIKSIETYKKAQRCFDDLDARKQTSLRAISRLQNPHSQSFT